jgi:short subunit dehydrogenase-like uncharacterized protein
MIYGATGYTGKLLVEESIKCGLAPILAGRNEAKVAALAKTLETDFRVFALDDPAAIARGLESVRCVLHAAGPFAVTAGPMIEACITHRVHYLDITGEFVVFELAESLSDRARGAGIMLMPGAGWDVVPSDCIALHTTRRTKEPKALRLGLKHFGSASRGSIKTGAGMVAVGPRARRNGAVVKPSDQQSAAFDFGAGPVDCVPLAMGDIITAWQSTRVPNIDVYYALGKQPSVEQPLDIERLPEGPTREERDAGRSLVIAEVTGADGKVSRSMIETSSGYSYTGEIGAEIARRVMSGSFKIGFQSPASAYEVELATSVGASKIIDFH